jgi:hypothetical protein
VFCGVKHAAKLAVLNGEMLDVVHKTFHAIPHGLAIVIKAKGPAEAGPMIRFGSELT